MPDLAPAARRVLQFMSANRASTLASSAREIAASTCTSDATVVRAAQALGYGGLSDLKRDLATAMDGAPNPADNMRRTLAEAGESIADAVDLVLRTHEEAVVAMRNPDVRSAIAGAVAVLSASDRIAIFGLGPSAALARYAAVCLARSGRRTLLLDRTGRLLADQLLDLRARDSLLVLTYGRPYREVVTTLSEARRLRVPIVLVTDAADHALASKVDATVAIPRGRAGQVALHGATLVALEALVLGLASALGGEALAALDRLNRLREAVGGPRGGT